MKKITFCLVLVFGVFISGKAQWSSVTSGVGADLTTIHFFDSQKGLCSGSFTTILYTTDGGNSWTKGSSQGFKDISFFNDNYGYGASSAGQSMGKTTNGGATWTSITPPTSNSLWGVSATSETSAYFVGTGGVFWYTLNGGASVSVGSSGTYNLLTDIVFTNYTTGYIAEQNGNILKTTNSGLSWNTVYTASSGVLTKMYFVDDNTGFVAGSDGAVYKTTNAGQAWSVLTTNSTSYLQGIYFYDANYGIAVGTDGDIFYTNDGGTNWDLQNSGVTEKLNDVYMLSASSAVVIGDNGLILKNNNISIGIKEQNSIDISIFPNPVVDKLLIKTSEIIKSVTVYDLHGKQIYSENEISCHKCLVDLSIVKPGVYFVRIATSKGDVIQKILK